MQNNGHAVSENPGHVIPKSTLVFTYVGLIVLSALMVGISRVNVAHFGIDWLDLQAIKAVIVMSIALVMGILVAMFLMGLRYEHKLLNLTVFVSNFVFLSIFVVFTWADTSFRGEVDPSFTKEINFTSPVKAEAAGAHGGAAEHGAAPASEHGTAPAADSQKTAPSAAPH